MNLLIKNIGRLYGVFPPDKLYLRGVEMRDCPYIEDAWLETEGENIKNFGKMDTCPSMPNGYEVIDAAGGIVTPAFCDSHTHLVWAGERTGEFIDKINGLSYEEIAARGGGILNSADLLNRTSEDELFEAAHRRLRSVMAMGTGAIEIKSGYGLTKEGELKMLRVIERLKKAEPAVEIRTTFLGAHAVGRTYSNRQDEYVDYMLDDVLPEAAGFCDFIDVFCDEGFFTPEQTVKILRRGKEYGLRGKIHANELAVSGGVQAGVSEGALSVDHLERMGDDEIAVLSSSTTIATMLPGASFFLGMPYGRARKAIEGGCVLALASDFNPGSSPSGSMGFVMSLGSIKMKLLPEESMNAVCLNGAAAMGISDKYGSICRGKKASLIVYEPFVKNLGYAAEYYSEPKIRQVILKGHTI